MKEAFVCGAIFLLFVAGAASVNKWLPTVGYSAEAVPAGTDYEICFRPGPISCTELIEREIASAAQTIDFEAYTLTSQRVVDALNHAATRGVQVRSVVDRKSTLAPQLPGEVRVDCKNTIMHNKSLIVDKTSIATGSFNFSNSAELRNAENHIWLHRADVTAEYEQNFEQLWARSISGTECPVKPKRKA